MVWTNACIEMEAMAAGLMGYTGEVGKGDINSAPRMLPGIVE